MFWNEEDYNRIYDVAKKELEFKVWCSRAWQFIPGEESFVSSRVSKEKKIL